MILTLLQKKKKKIEDKRNYTANETQMSEYSDKMSEPSEHKQWMFSKILREHINKLPQKMQMDNEIHLIIVH